MPNTSSPSSSSLVLLLLLLQARSERGAAHARSAAGRWSCGCCVLLCVVCLSCRVVEPAFLGGGEGGPNKQGDDTRAHTPFSSAIPTSPPPFPSPNTHLRQERQEPAAGLGAGGGDGRVRGGGGAQPQAQAVEEDELGPVDEGGGRGHGSGRGGGCWFFCFFLVCNGVDCWVLVRVWAWVWRGACVTRVCETVMGKEEAHSPPPPCCCLDVMTRTKPAHVRRSRREMARCPEAEGTAWPLLLPPPP